MIPDISVVILCYKTGVNAKEFISEVIDQISKANANYEIILVGNYLKGDNSDETPEVVREFASSDSRIKAITLEKKGMMGWDARSGLEAATGRTIVIIDGDGQMLPEDPYRVYQKLLAENLDMVKTYRRKRYDGILRKINSDVYNALFRLLFPGFKVRDINSKPKIFTRQFLDKLELTSDDWFFDAEVMIQARRLRCKLGEIPTEFYESKHRKSFIRPRHVLEFLRNLTLARFREFFVKTRNIS